MRLGDTDAALPEPVWSPVGSRAAEQYGPPLPPVINNNITVEGSATPAVAREVADRAGTASAAALGRDRAAVGATFGVTP